MQREAAQFSVHGTTTQSHGSSRVVNMTGPTILTSKMSAPTRGPAAMTGRLPKKDPIAIYKDTVSTRHLSRYDSPLSCYFISFHFKVSLAIIKLSTHRSCRLERMKCADLCSVNNLLLESKDGILLQ